MIAPRMATIRTNSVLARRKASRCAALLEQLGEDRDERGAQRRVGEQARTRFGTWKAIVNAQNAPLVPK